ncbi:Exosome complex component RRP45 [Boothiomyces macroporosus]|uniref:Exosome complex component RRP45 n=1 Tax=Boothiomyces macroporosus TaxID=261099 RepID=A0AAD5Y1Z2_9FUNG|nr:Exosome complex component RRP45 [Boothiomyces macroporosus]
MQVVSQIEKDFISTNLKANKRLDFRQKTDLRKIKLTFGSSFGQCQVSLGKTKVTANVSCEITRPGLSSSTEGSIQFNTEISPICCLDLPDVEVVISRMLEKSLRVSRAVDTEGLCIIAGEKVWSIKVDVRVIDHEGNLFDCCCLAAMAALLHFRRPEVTVSGKDVIIHSVDDKVPIPLSIHHIPTSTTFGIYQENYILDPTLLEEQVADGELVIVMNAHKEICCIKQSASVATEEVLQCMQIASVKAVELTAILKEAIKKDSESRNK